MKQLLFTLALGLAAFSIKAQSTEPPDYIYMEGKDTIWCRITFVHRAENKVNTITYKDQSGKEITIGKNGVSGVKACLAVKSFRVEGIQSDLMPEDAPKDKELIHKEIKLKGKITVYSELLLEAETATGDRRSLHYHSHWNNAEKTVLFPDGSYLDWDKALIKIKDMLEKCSIVVPNFKAPDKEWEEAIRQYNEGCK